VDIITLLRTQLRAAHEYLEGTMDGVTTAQAQWIPPGTATPIGANYIHMVQSEDAIMNQLLQHKEMLGATTWADKLGASEPHPPPGTSAEDYFAWSRRVQLDLPAFREYAQAVYAASDDYIAGLSPNDLDEVLDLSSMGMAPVTRAWVLTRYVIGHADNICGETSTMKGLQGAGGYQE
jgi:DinB superfamily